MPLVCQLKRSINPPLFNYELVLKADKGHPWPESLVIHKGGCPFVKVYSNAGASAKMQLPTYTDLYLSEQAVPYPEYFNSHFENREVLDLKWGVHRFPKHVPSFALKSLIFREDAYTSGGNGKPRKYEFSITVEVPQNVALMGANRLHIGGTIMSSTHGGVCGDSNSDLGNHCPQFCCSEFLSAK